MEFGPFLISTFRPGLRSHHHPLPDDGRGLLAGLSAFWPATQMILPETHLTTLPPGSTPMHTCGHSCCMQGKDQLFLAGQPHPHLTSRHSPPSPLPTLASLSAPLPLALWHLLPALPLPGGCPAPLAQVLSTSPSSLHSVITPQGMASWPPRWDAPPTPQQPRQPRLQLNS